MYIEVTSTKAEILIIPLTWDTTNIARQKWNMHRKKYLSMCLYAQIDDYFIKQYISTNIVRHTNRLRIKSCGVDRNDYRNHQLTYEACSFGRRSTDLLMNINYEVVKHDLILFVELYNCNGKPVLFIILIV